MEYTHITDIAAAAKVMRPARQQAAHHGSGRQLPGTRTLGPAEIVLIGVCIACLVLVVAAGLHSADPPAPDVWTAVLVPQSGTVWDLAREHPATGLTTAETVDLILAHNGLSSATLFVGQSVAVPAGETVLSVADRR